MNIVEQREGLLAPQPTLLYVVRNALYEVGSPLVPEHPEKHRIILGTMMLLEWARREKFRIQSEMVKQALAGNNRSVDEVFDALPKESSSLHPNCLNLRTAVVSDVGEGIAESLLQHLTLLKEGERLVDLRASRWSYTWNRRFGGTNDGLDTRSFYHALPTDISGLCVAVRTHDKWRIYDPDKYEISVKFAPEAMKTILKAPLPENPFAAEIIPYSQLA